MREKDALILLQMFTGRHQPELKKIREELKFDGLDALKQQIGVDVAQVREVLSAPRI